MTADNIFNFGIIVNKDTVLNFIFSEDIKVSVMPVDTCFCTSEFNKAGFFLNVLSPTELNLKCSTVIKLDHTHSKIFDVKNSV